MDRAHAPQRRKTGLLVLLGTVVLGGWLWSSLFGHVRAVEATTLYPTFEVAAEPLVLAVEPGEVVRGSLSRGQSIFGLLNRYGVSAEQQQKLLESARQITDLSRVRVGTPYRIHRGAGGDMTSFELDYSTTRLLRISATPFGFLASAHPIEFVTRSRTLSGTAGNSLFAPLMGEEGGPDLIRRLRNLFAWRIDFNRDVRPGDHYKITVDEVWRDGQFDRFGLVRYVRLNVRSQVMEALRYGAEFYDPEGRAIRGTLLPSPVEYAYISSHFSSARRHPVKGFVKPHYGVDFAASYGSPVRAAGDGEVTFSAHKGANGRLVTIRHNGVYRTAYAHLSRFGRGIKRGVQVKQGQIIGYVGSSGLSTGSHLHYAVYRDGRPVNPLKLDYTPISESVSLALDNDFQLAWDTMRLAVSRQESAPAAEIDPTLAQVAAR